MVAKRVRKDVRADVVMQVNMAVYGRVPLMAAPSDTQLSFYCQPVPQRLCVLRV